MSSLAPGNANQPLLLKFQYRCTSAENKVRVLDALRTAAAHQVKHWPETLTYCFANEEGLDITLIEVYANEQVFWQHSADATIGDALSVLFDRNVRDDAATHGIAVGDPTEGVRAILLGINAVVLKDGVIAGGLNLRKPTLPAATTAATPVVCVVRVDLPSATAALGARGNALDRMHSFVKSASAHAAVMTAVAFLSNATTIEAVITSVSSDSIASLLLHASSASSSLLSKGARVQLFGDVRDAVKQMLTNGLADSDVHVSYACDIIGYAIHPSLVAASSSSSSATSQGEVVGDKNKLSRTAAAVVAPSLFTVVVNEFTGKSEKIQFARDAPGRSPHLAGKAPTTATASDQTLVIPLLHVLRKLVSRGSLDLDVPIELVFSQLERLRAMARNIELINRTAASGGGAAALRESSDSRIARALENFAALGFTMRANDTAIVCDGLRELIATIEHEWRDIIVEAHRTVQSDQSVAYLGLMEVFHIGDLVVASAAGLGGELVVYAINDIVFTPNRSMFGGRKWVFTVGLEMIVSFGRHFVMASFEEMFEEWSGVKALSDMLLRPITAAVASECAARGAIVSALDVKPAFRSFRAGTFFAHRGTASGGSSAEGQHTSLQAGRCVVDVERGLALGHGPGTSYDNAGIAIQSALKAYRVVRTARESELLERCKQANLRIYERLPSELAMIAWPAVVAFNFNSKSWGHVLAHGLSEIEFSDALWERLVLPDRTKELLLATTASGIAAASAIVSGKSSASASSSSAGAQMASNGNLFLLYGPPGVGKTATVEALAERFRRPLYSLSFGELGTTPGELERTFVNVLALCAEWRAIVLLDEGDALVERREKGQLLLNSLVGVLLRTLDRFDGTLFITTNRIRTFDPAAISRVTLAIRYDALTPAARSKVWYNLLKRVGADATTFDLVKLGALNLSGRDINHIAKLGLALAAHRGVALDNDTLLSALDAWSQCRHDLQVEDF